MLSRFIGLIVALSLMSSAYAFPKQIIIIRHAEKLAQTEPGPVLTAKGQLRALRFAFYYLNHFGEPDYIFATNPVNAEGKNSALREIETVAPLANILAEKHLDTGYPIFHPYESSDFDKLAEHLLTHKKFDKASILICWNHKRIAQFAKALHVKEHIPDWPSDDYDSVYILKYDANGGVQFTMLHQQYPVAFSGGWHQLYEALSPLY